MRARGLLGKMGVLAPAYFVQGLPFGFQAHSLQLYLLDAGVSIEGVGFASLLALPWMLKILWAPLVDGIYSERFGRRKTWIVPMQAAVASCCLGLAALPPGTEQLWPVLVAVFAMNLFAATMDIAVDGLAVSMLDERELGWGNVGQVVGYKLGMLVGGNLLLPVAERWGWSPTFAIMGGCVVPALLIALTMRERGPALGADEDPAPHACDSTGRRTLIREVFVALRRAMFVPGAVGFLVVVATYKLGESVGDAMFRPWLYANGFDKSDLGIAVGLPAALFSMVGSALGGWLAVRWSGLRAVAIAAVARVLPLIAIAAVALTSRPPGLNVAIALSVTESVFGGALTVTMFAAMMARVDPEIGGTHYTAMATLEVLGKAPGAVFSGVLVGSLGFGGAFVVAVVLSLAFLGALPFAMAGPASETDRPVVDGTSS